VKYLNENLTTNPNERKRGYGPLNFPNLIICDKYSLFKSNGVPYGMPIQEDGYWPFYFSSNHNPLLIMLEMIWTRLQYLFELPSEIFGDDLESELHHPFLIAKLQSRAGLRGWEYNEVTLDTTLLEEPLGTGSWEPAFLSELEFTVVSYLCKHEYIDCLNDKGFQQLLKENKTTLEKLRETLEQTGLVAFDKDKMVLLSEKCSTVVLPDGRLIAGENKTGRLTRWVKRFMDDTKKEKE
jgi:hypothetical protein